MNALKAAKPLMSYSSVENHSRYSPLKLFIKKMLAVMKAQLYIISNKQ